MSGEPDPGVDTTTPNVARMYDYYLGGSLNFAADRELATKVIDRLPEVRGMAIANRQFQGRAVRYVAEQGVRQFLDLGAGIPTVNPTHEVAREVQPDAKVAYVDSEPVAVSHARMHLSGDDGATAIHARLEDVDEVLAAAGELLDFSEPVAVMMVAILHFVPDEDDPAGIVARYAGATGPGSYLIASHGTDEGHGKERVDEAVRSYRESANYSLHARGKSEFGTILAPYELVEPGIVWTTQWRPEFEVDEESARKALFYAAVGRRS